MFEICSKILKTPERRHVNFEQISDIVLVLPLLTLTKLMPAGSLRLKLVSAVFCQIFIFSPNDSPSKTLKNIFYFIEKALFVLEVIKFL